jgi:hypothetical protein
VYFDIFFSLSNQLAMNQRAFSSSIISATILLANWGPKPMIRPLAAQPAQSRRSTGSRAPKFRAALQRKPHRSDDRKQQDWQAGFPAKAECGRQGANVANEQQQAAARQRQGRTDRKRGKPQSIIS